MAQELLCRVAVNHRQIQGSNTQIYNSLQKDITEFMNSRRWTNHTYEQNERIECNILITINEYNGIDRFTGSIQITSTRPVYNTSYNTPLVNFKEMDNELIFSYIENQPLEFNETTHQNNLSSVLAFYAYIILGYDYNSFSLNGGSLYFQKAQKIVSNAQSASEPGWKAYDSKNQNNRYFITEALTDKAYEPLHQTLYKYHRLGMDNMSKSADAARREIIESLKLLQQIHRVKPNAFILQLFFTAKSDEIINIFSESPSQEKQEVYNILKEIDVANIAKYQKILQRN